MIYPDLETANLRLSFFDKSVESHYAKIYESYNDPFVIANLGKIINSYADIDSRSRFSIPPELCHKSPPPEYTFVLSFLKGTTTYVGYISAHFKGEDRTSPYDAQMGWAMLQEHWGKGYATEAAAAIVKWCDEVLGLERIGAQVFVANIASCRVAEKAGGKLRDNRITVVGDVDQKKTVEYKWVFENAARGGMS